MGLRLVYWLLQSFGALCFSPVARIHGVATSVGIRAARALVGFSPVARIHGVATLPPKPGSANQREFQSRCQDSWGCD